MAASVMETVVERLAGPVPADAGQFRTLFHEHVVANPDPNQDDLLFFVRKRYAAVEDAIAGQTELNPNLRREVCGVGSPPSASPSPTPSPSPSGSLLRGKGTPSPAAAAGPPSDDIIFVKRRSAAHTVTLTPDEEADVRWKETLYLNLLVQLHCELTVAVCTKLIGQDGRSTMQAQRHVTKRVYASPSKTRMDKKGHEYSYSFPLIFFNVEDFEDAFSNLVINEQEYLCVELRVRLPSAQDGQPDRHVTIFQGAVSWDAINTTFQKQTTPKSIWERVEYIMMRGPRSKGHCQVAVSITDDEVAGSANGGAAGRRTPGSSASGTLRGLVKMAQQMAQSIADRPIVIKQLKCCLTFVNVSWQSIVNDISATILGPKSSLIMVEEPATV